MVRRESPTAPRSVSGSAAFLDLIGSREIDLLAIGEARTCPEWGHDSGPTTCACRVAERLGRPDDGLPTATPQVVAEIARLDGDERPGRKSFRLRPAKPELRTIAPEVQGSARKQALLELGHSRPSQPPGDRLLRHRKTPRAGPRTCGGRSRPFRGRIPLPALARTSAHRPSTRFTGRRRRGRGRHQCASAWESTRPTSGRSGTGRSLRALEAYHPEAGLRRSRQRTCGPFCWR